MSEFRPFRSRKLSLLTVLVLILSTAVSTAVIAGHDFNDVPNSNQFHGSISWMADNEITVGCNDAGTEFCPTDNVRRETMSSFLRRFGQTFGANSDQVVDTSDNVPIDLATAIAVASVEVAPKAEANVVLNAHVTFAGGAPNNAWGSYELRRGDCSGGLLASGGWDDDSSFNVSKTFALTGADVVSSATTYVLCVEANGSAAEVRQRALTATWAPTA